MISPGFSSGVKTADRVPMMMRARRFLHTDEILSGIIIIGALGLIFDLLFAALHRKMFPYLGEKR